MNDYQKTYMEIYAIHRSSVTELENKKKEVLSLNLDNIQKNTLISYIEAKLRYQEVREFEKTHSIDYIIAANVLDIYQNELDNI